MQVHVHLYFYFCFFVYVHVCACVCACMYVHVCMCMCMCMYMHMYCLVFNYFLLVLQRYDERKMLQLIIDAAINWMQTGLPLKLLKIVLYTNKPNNPDKNIMRVVQCFVHLKNKWLSKWKEEQVDKVQMVFHWHFMSIF